MNITLIRIIAALTILLTTMIACESEKPASSSADKQEAVLDKMQKTEVVVSDKEMPANPEPDKILKQDVTAQANSQIAATNDEAVKTDETIRAKVMPPMIEKKEDTNKQALALAQKSGCLVCHKLEKKLVGPAWKDVAIRYASDPKAKSKLLIKVVKGGRGNWTKEVGAASMPPYSPRVSSENIENLVDFILSLK